jgi:hypothetical protein
MQNQGVFSSGGFQPSADVRKFSGSHIIGVNVSRKITIGIILIVALFSFEIFNFDTTRFALQYLLGDVSFWGMRWATILAVAFCAIDFAGLARLFTPEQGSEEPRTVWYLMGAWLLGATMNALMTWWAVSLTLLSHEFGNEVLSRDQLLEVVPVFVAALVWLTRILFIGALSVAGEHLFDLERRKVTDRMGSARRQAANLRPEPFSPAPVSAGRSGVARRRAGGRPRPAVTSTDRSHVSRRKSRQHRPMPGRLQQVQVGVQARGRQR